MYEMKVKKTRKKSSPGIQEPKAITNPFVLVIFGVTGDLAQNKLMPSLFSLYQQGYLPEEFMITGFARREMSAEELRGYFGNLKTQPGWEKFARHLVYQQGYFEEEEGYQALRESLRKYDQEIGECAFRLFYLATPPVNYNAILENLDRSGLSRGCDQGGNKWTRVIVEKPFGEDLETARALDRACAVAFEEKQIFRVDHYLGKETVQNMLAFRFANGIFEPAWNRNYIDHVQITWAEKKGIEGRGKFFDRTGLLRDIAQNHLMQLVAAVGMEQPESFINESIRDARAAVIRAIRLFKPEEVAHYTVRGQYAGYREERDVNPASETETFAALKFFLDTPRFEGVPFYIRAGKKMPQDLVEVLLFFRQTCPILFEEYGCPETGNVLRIRIQPDEGISIRFIAKKPGVKLALQTVNMKFSYREEFPGKLADAYEKILLDIFRGDQTLCSRSDELEYSWELIARVMEGWSGKKAPPLLIYNPGEWGPAAADDLIAGDHRQWEPGRKSEKAVQSLSAEKMPVQVNNGRSRPSDPASILKGGPENRNGGGHR
jgi:glucose-6-phosphate 1-dehydrogenase